VNAAAPARAATRLRRKLEDDPARPQHLLTEPGMGYRYAP
jgi:two-component system KDP operon response regulator KdpE